MARTVDELVSEMRALSRDVMCDVVDRVLLETHGGHNPERAAVWSETIHSRIDEVLNGQVEGFPDEVTSAKSRRIIGR